MKGTSHDEDPEYSPVHGLLLRLSNKDGEKSPLNSREENKATTEVANPGNDLSQEKPIFVVQVRGDLVDSEAPVMEVDIGNWDISVDWRMIFTSYFDQYLAGVRQKEKVSDYRAATGDTVSIDIKLTIRRMRSCHTTKSSDIASLLTTALLKFPT